MDQSAAYKLTQTQIGAIGESLVAAELVFASNGRLAPFTPFADDGGIDLLIFDKHTKGALPIQVKSRLKVDDEKAQTVQFDVRKATFSDGGNSHLIAILVNRTNLLCAWLIPMGDIRMKDDTKRDTYRVVASAKPTSNDQYSSYRYSNYEDLARAVIALFPDATR